MRKVITYGTYDLLHIGHINLLRRAKELGDFLIVAISTDEFNELKGKKTVIPYRERAEIIKSIRYVDEVIPEENWEQKVQDIRNHHIDVFTMGDDWEGRFDFLKEHCKVEYLKRTESISSTLLKEEISRFKYMSDLFNKISVEDLRNISDILEKIINLK